MPHPFQIFSQSDYLIHIVDINSHTEWQTVQIQISWLLRSVCKGRVYPGSVGQGLRIEIIISPDKGRNQVVSFVIFRQKKNNAKQDRAEACLHCGLGLIPGAYM